MMPICVSGGLDAFLSVCVSGIHDACRVFQVYMMSICVSGAHDAYLSTCVSGVHNVSVW